MRALIYLFLACFNSIYHQFTRNSLRVLAYHTVPDKGKFRKQIKYLNKNFRIISLPQLQELLLDKTPMPKNCLIITFDDGDVSVLTNGLPVLSEYKLPSVLFIITRLIDSSETFWPRWVEKIFKIEGKSYSEARNKINQLKKVSNFEREKYLKTLEQIDSPQLTSIELKLMESKGVFIGNHTHTHPMINKCSESEIKNELNQVNKKFAQWSLSGYPVFAYPNGNWDERTEDILKDEGIKLAFLFDHRLAAPPVNPLRISRIMVDADSDINEFKVKVSGFHSYLMKLKNNF